MNTPLESGELLLREGSANLWRGLEAVGGKLYLSSQRLVFESHAFNLQSGVTVLALSSIESVRFRNTLWVVPNGLELSLNDGTRHRFVLWGRAQWLAAINAAKSAAAGGEPPASEP